MVQQSQHGPKSQAAAALPRALLAPPAHGQRPPGDRLPLVSALLSSSGLRLLCLPSASNKELAQDPSGPFPLGGLAPPAALTSFEMQTSPTLDLGCQPRRYTVLRPLKLNSVPLPALLFLTACSSVTDLLSLRGQHSSQLENPR